MRRRVIAVVAAAVVVAAGGVCATWAGADVTPDDSSLIAGFYRPTQQIPLTNLTVTDGTYRVTYAAEVQFFADRPDTMLECGLVDASGRIGYLDDTTFPVRANGE